MHNIFGGVGMKTLLFAVLFAIVVWVLWCCKACMKPNTKDGHVARPEAIPEMEIPKTCAIQLPASEYPKPIYRLIALHLIFNGANMLSYEMFVLLGFYKGCIMLVIEV